MILEDNTQKSDEHDVSAMFTIKTELVAQLWCHLYVVTILTWLEDPDII